MTSQDRMKLGFFEQPWLRRGFLVVLTGVLVGCAQGNIGRAPVESRSLPRGSAAPLADGQYRVQPGDTLVRIAAMYNQNWRDLATWNQLSDPDSLEVGQILRLSAPRSGSGVAAKPAPAPVPTPAPTPVQRAEPASEGVVVQPVKSAQVQSTQVKPLEKPVDQAALGDPPKPAVSDVPDTAKAKLVSGLNLRWPTNGEVIATYDEQTNKGIGIAGKVGDPVLAAADGRVVYAGSGLRGYGNLVILKHDDTFLTAYAHNQALSVREDQTVKQGEKIAEMGSSDADRVKLHFEVRQLGKPVDPLIFLPQR